jgi:hypothetical protein
MEPDTLFFEDKKVHQTNSLTTTITFSPTILPRSPHTIANTATSLQCTTTQGLLGGQGDQKRKSKVEAKAKAKEEVTLLTVLTFLPY